VNGFLLPPHKTEVNTGMKQSGWRKPTPGLGIAEQLAQAGEKLTVPKNKALLACKRVAAHIGLKASDMMLLDTFGAFTQSHDWEEGAPLSGHLTPI
jgi:replication initiation protein RepC